MCCFWAVLRFTDYSTLFWTSSQVFFCRGCQALSLAPLVKIEGYVQTSGFLFLATKIPQASKCLAKIFFRRRDVAPAAERTSSTCQAPRHLHKEAAETSWYGQPLPIQQCAGTIVSTEKTARVRVFSTLVCCYICPNKYTKRSSGRATNPDAAPNQVLSRTPWCR